MISKEKMGERLLQEIKRIGYTQASFAHQTGKTRQQISNYGKGKSEMTAEFLALAYQLGVDIQYVITGTTSTTLYRMPIVDDDDGLVLYENFWDLDLDDMEADPKLGGIDPTEDPAFSGGLSREMYETECISQEQKDALQVLVNEIWHADPNKSTRAIWKALVRHCNVTTYHLIEKNDYDKALLFLQKWLNNLKSKP